ncbi:MAG: STAS domain-containing protein [Planctomycetota bacterium]|jgi:anti-anti-sigma factor
MTDGPAYQFENGKRFAVVEFYQPLASRRWSDIEQIGDELKTQIGDLSNPVFLLDLSRLEFMGSSVVALIVRLWKSTQERGGDMIVVNSSTMIKEVLDIAGLSRVWTIVESRDEAETILSNPPYYEPDSPKSIYLLAALGWVAAAGAVFGTVVLQRQLPVLDAEVARYVVFGSGGAGAVCGLISLIAAKHAWRWLGLLLLIVAGGVIGAAAVS